LPGVVANATCPRITRLIRGSASNPETSAHRQHPAGDTEHPAHLVERGDRIGEHVRQPRQNQIPDRMSGECPVAAEPMLDGRGPHPAARAVGRQRRQCHAQIARRHDTEFGTNPAG
jgi:hypothetical protein